MVTTQNVCSVRITPDRLFILLALLIFSIAFTPTTHAQGTDGTPLHGFADVGFSMHSPESTDPKGFNVGSLDFYLTPQFNDNVKGLIEIIFETTPEGEIATDLERMQMGYTFSDAATVWAGRFHTPYGYWNTGFHHGAQMQTSVVRPRFLDFEDKGGILPAHMVGMLGTGKVRVGEGKLTYDIFAGNGPQVVDGTLSINAAGDDNRKAMTGLNIGYEASGILDGLRLAVHALRGEVTDNAVAPNNTEINMSGGAIMYFENDWEFLSELYIFNNTDISGATGKNRSTTSYAQIGKTFSNWTPFIRKEVVVLSQSDNYFTAQANGQSYNREAAGFKYDLNPKASIKLELHNSDFEAGGGNPASSYRSLLIQHSIRF
ncbi:MAG: hypothetical protein R8M11_03870 [Gallionella sp.]